MTQLWFGALAVLHRFLAVPHLAIALMNPAWVFNTVTTAFHDGYNGSAIATKDDGAYLHVRLHLGPPEGPQRCALRST
jgi:hypothetical protein